MLKVRWMTFVAVCAALLTANTVLASDEAALIVLGQAVFLEQSKGNCIACHAISDPQAQLAGHQGPPIFNMKLRYPDKRLLRAQVWDATRNNPLTLMPPFGKHWILSEHEIDAVVEYIYQY